MSSGCQYGGCSTLCRGWSSEQDFNDYEEIAKCRRCPLNRYSSLCEYWLLHHFLWFLLRVLGIQLSENAGFSFRWLNCSFESPCLCIFSSFYILAIVTIGPCARSYYQTAVWSICYKKDFTLFKFEGLLQKPVSVKGNFVNNFIAA